MMKLAILFGLVLSASCMVLHQPQIPLTFGLQYRDTPNYNFAYEVNDAHTGDIKSQHESRRGETVLGQYTLLQPDGIRRTVDYRADEHAGFRASVNNDGRGQANNAQHQIEPQNNYEPQRSNSAPDNLPGYWPAPTQAPTSAPAVAVSRSSIVQTFAHGNNNPWI